MRLFHIPVFMCHPSIVPGGLHPVMLHERLITNRPVFSLLLAQLSYGGAEMVSSVLLWHSTQLPERFLDPLSQGLKRFAEAQADRLCVGVGEHKVIDHVREGFPCNGHAQILHMGEIRLCSLARLVSLLKEHFVLWPMYRSPSGN